MLTRLIVRLVNAVERYVGVEPEVEGSSIFVGESSFLIKRFGVNLVVEDGG